MSDQPTLRLGLLAYLPRIIALVVLAGISGFIVWSFHTVDWPAFLGALVIGGLLGFLAGGLVGVHLAPTVAAMLGFGGLFEGVYQGWRCWGWAGAVLGGPVGVFGGYLVVWLVLLLLHLVLILCGIDPFENPDSSEEKQGGSSPEATSRM
jgi:hypothetical protein